MTAQERITALKKMLEVDPTDSFLNYAIALEYSHSGNTNTAIDLIESVLARDENYLGAYLQLGQLYESKLLPEKAIEIYEKGCKIALLQKKQKSLSELRQAIMNIETN